MLPRLGQLPAHNGGLQNWFLRGAYNGSFDQTNGSLVLSNVAPAELLSFITYDYERFALASWESFYLASLESETYKLVGWPLLKMYYAAFFAAHALMRATGEAIVKVDRQPIDALNEMVRITDGIFPNLRPGMFHSQVREIQPGQLSVILSPHAEGAGVHDGFWRAFTSFLDQAAVASATNKAVDANIFLAGIAELTPKVRGWLSARRNEINYQHTLGVWFPLAQSNSINDRISAVKRVDSKTVDLSPSLDSTLPAFIATTQFLSCLNAEVADYVAARSSASRAFGSKWRRFHSQLPYLPRKETNAPA